VVENWNGPFTGTLTKQLGSMFIKSVRIEQNKGGGTTVRLSCTSISPEIGFRLERKSRAWTQTTVRDVCAQIATDNGLTLNYTPSSNPAMERVDQHDHSDSYEVQKISSDNDFSFKVINGSLWVRDRHAVEQSSPVATIVCPSPQGGPGGLNNSGVIHWEFIESTEDANYADCDLTYRDNTTGNTVSGTATDPTQTGPGPHLRYHNDPRTGVPQATDNITLE
jgi:hypothetical protein